MDLFKCLYAPYSIRNESRADKSGKSILVIETPKHEALPHSHSEAVLQEAYTFVLVQLPAISQRAAGSDVSRPRKTLHERVLNFIKGCSSRFKGFFAQKKLISDFEKYISTKNGFLTGRNLFAVWQNIKEDFFCGAKFGDIEKFCNELCRRIDNANQNQLEGINDFMIDLEGYAKDSSLKNLAAVYKGFFSKLSDALMSRNLDRDLEDFVESVYVHERGRGGKDLTPLPEVKEKMPEVLSKIYELQLRSMVRALPDGTDEEKCLEDKKLELKNNFLERADKVYEDVCSKTGNGALTRIACASVKKKFEKEFERLMKDILVPLP
jgi:hypothetical protein